MTTVRDLVKSSLRLIGVLGAGENMENDEATDALSVLNQMLSLWSADGNVLFNNSVDTKTLTTAYQYTMGIGGDINTARPANIQAVTINTGGATTNLNIWRSDVYSTIEFPIQGTPEDIYVNSGFPLLTLSLNPKPVGGEVMTIYSQKPLTSLTLNDTLQLPDGYEMALRYNLAMYLAPEYEREVTPSVRDTAMTSFATIKNNAMQYSKPLMGVDMELTEDNWNIYTGYYR